MFLQHLLIYQMPQYQFFRYFGCHLFVPGIFRRNKYHGPMLALTGTAGSNGVCGIVNVLRSNSVPDLICGSIRSFIQAGVTITDKYNVLNFVQVFSHKI